jgi:hypothetical protein
MWCGQVAIKTSALEEKSTACNMLVCYFAELQEGMFPYIQMVANIMVPLLSFIFSEDIRIAASALMPELIKSAVLSMRSGLCDAAYVRNLMDFIMEKLIKVWCSVCMYGGHVTLELRPVLRSCRISSRYCIRVYARS